MNDGEARILAEHCRGMLLFASDLQWASYDPFDFLLAPMGEQVRRRSPFAARCLVQLGRRSGARLRSVAGIGRHVEAKALADFVHTCAILASRKELEAEWASELIPLLVNRLESVSLTTPSGRAWGLGFPYASRFVSVPAHTPNAYTTVCAMRALMKVATAVDDERMLQLATSGAEFLICDLGVVTRDSTSWFRYWPSYDGYIVNVQALIAGALQELAVVSGEAKFERAATLAARAAVRAQQPDGRFPYAIDDRGRFVDAFHTGFTLEGLAQFEQSAGGPLDPPVKGVLERGMEFLAGHLIDADGWPLRSPHGHPALDGQNVGQLIQTLVICGTATDHLQACAILRRWMTHFDSLRAKRPASLSLRWDIAPVTMACAHLAAALTDGRPQMGERSKGRPEGSAQQ